MKFSKLSPPSPAWLKDILAFIGWFSEKGSQVEPSHLTAFGISLESRYGKADKIRSMLAFAETAAHAGVAGYIASVLYDSKAYICHYELRDTAFRRSAVLETIRECALMTLPQFEDHEGICCHGGGAPE